MVGELQRFKAAYLKAVAHPVRIRALEVLRQGEVAVADIQTQMGDAVANISQHLAVLRGAGIVTTHKVGLKVLYRVRDEEIFVILDSLREVFSHRLDSMQTVLEADDEATAANKGRPRRARGGTPDGQRRP